MRKLLVVFIVIACLVAAVFLFSGGQGSTGGSVFTASSSDLDFIKKQTLAFCEDIKYKDYEKAASYHSRQDRVNADIPKHIEKCFLVKPELLEVLRYEILSADLDSSETRGRVKVKIVARILNTDEVKDETVILYWDKTPAEGWVMRLDSSLPK